LIHLFSQDTRESVYLPHIASNSYLRKIRLSNISTISDDVVMVDYAKHWPAVKIVDGVGNATMVQCPSHMHTVLWGASQTVVARLYISVSKSPFDYFSSEMRTDQNIPLHFQPLRNRHNGNADHSVQFSETTLMRNEFLFVPGDLVAGVHLLSNTEDQPFGQVMHMCFVDASNINDFREAIRVAGLVSAYERQLEGLLDPLVLDVGMNRQPVELSVRQFFDVDSFIESENSEFPIKPEIKQRSDRRRRGATGSDFKLWQEQNSWNLLVKSLTIPTPLKPILVAVGRNNASITWRSHFTPTAADQSFFGFRVFICESGDLKDASCRNLTLSSAKDMGSKFGSFIGMESSWYSAVVEALSPNASYVFSVSLLHDKTESSRSEWSMAVRTASQTVPTAPCSISGVTGDPPDVLIRFHESSVQCVLQFKKPTGTLSLIVSCL
jgi:hypothetical protein